MREKEGALYILVAFKMRCILIFNRNEDKFCGQKSEYTHKSLQNIAEEILWL